MKLGLPMKGGCRDTSEMYFLGGLRCYEVM
jgi:hypothetical protein